MGRMGIGPDEGDGGFDWSCPRCNYPNPSGASSCMGCSFSGTKSSSDVSQRCCSCSCHDKQHEKPARKRRPSKKELADEKKFLKSLLNPIPPSVGNKILRPEFLKFILKRKPLIVPIFFQKKKVKRKPARKK